MRTYNQLTISLFSLVMVLLGGPALGQTDSLTQPKKVKKIPQKVATAKPLFATDDVLSLTLAARMQPIIRDRTPLKKGETGKDHPALLTVMDDDGQAVQMPVQLQVRGNFRLSSSNCDFPPLYLNLPKQAAKGTPFARQSKLKLITHCISDDYVVREYLVYRAYTLLTDLSYRARLAQVTYADSAKKGNSITRWAVLLEDIDDVAKRNGATAFKNRYRAERCDTLSMAMVGIFQYLIGNTDWSVVYRHNIRLLTDSTHARPMPIPYDFDHSGLVGTPYAMPAQQVDITSVRERIYRGPLYPTDVLSQVAARFMAVKPQLYALYESEKHIDRTYLRKTIAYLDEFYAIISDPKQVNAVFRNPDRSGVQIKGLNR